MAVTIALRWAYDTPARLPIRLEPGTKVLFGRGPLGGLPFTLEICCVLLVSSLTSNNKTTMPRRALVACTKYTRPASRCPSVYSSISSKGLRDNRGEARAIVGGMQPDERGHVGGEHLQRHPVAALEVA
jgi:hypothetical protein